MGFVCSTCWSVSVQCRRVRKQDVPAVHAYPPIVNYVLDQTSDTFEMERLKSGEVGLGTFIMAVQFDGGVVLGADSRTTTGGYITNRVADKLTYVHDQIYCCRSGSAADTEFIVDAVYRNCQLLTQLRGAPPLIATVAASLEEMCYDNKSEMSAGIIVAGWDKEEGPSVYNIPVGGGLFRQPWAVGGSGSSYVYGYCDATYREGWGRDETVEFVKNSTLALAISRDSLSGGAVHMCVITQEGVELLFVPSDKLPMFWEGKQGLSIAPKKSSDNVPIAIG